MSNQEKNKNQVIYTSIALLKSGFFSLLKPQDFQTLIALCAFADYEGKLKVSSKALAKALNLSEKQAQLRIKKVCNLRWQGKPLVVKENGNAKFTPNCYRLMLPEGMMLIQEGNFVGKSMCMEGERKKESPLPEAEVSYNSNVVVNNYKTTYNNKQRLVENLKIEGLTEEIAVELVENYPYSRITAQLEMLPYRKAKNPAEMLIKAIKENWAPPQAYIEFLQQKARQRAEEEKRAKEEDKRKERHQKIEAIKAKMSQKEMQEMRKRAEQKIPQVIKDAYKAKKIPLPEILIESQINHIIGTEYL